MKDWLSIGQFASETGLSVRALRIYEDLGLLKAHRRGENGYRYYLRTQTEQAQRIQQFKGLGFSLNEIKTLLETDLSMDSAKLKTFLQQRLAAVIEQARDISNQKGKIEEILTSLETTTKGLGLSERRYIMSHFEKVSIVVTGVKNLEATATHISQHLGRQGQVATVVHWEPGQSLPEKRPHILVVREELLGHDEVKQMTPDVVVITGLRTYDANVEKSYLNLYQAVGPHMATVFNADDRISVALAANETIRKGKTYYFSKNSGLENQIQRIGGVLSDGEQIKIYGANQTREVLNVRLNQLHGFDEEIALIASLAAVMDIGLNAAKFIEFQNT